MSWARQHRSILAALAIALVALAGSLPGIHNDFANDDVLVVQDNARVHDFGDAAKWFTASYWPPPYAQDLYRPLTLAALTTEYVVGDGQPVVFRIVSYALYAAVCIAFFFFVRRFASDGIAFAAALLFAAHPVHVEAVALAVAQNEMMVALLALGATWFYLGRREALTRRDWAMLGGAYAVACLLKEHGFVLPALLLCAELFLVAERPLRTRARQVGVGFLSLGAIGITLLLVRAAVLRSFTGSFTAPAINGADFTVRALTMLRVVPEWVRLFAWPAHLRADYSPQELTASTGFGPVEALGLLILAAALAMRVWSQRRAPLVAFGLSWCAISLLPVSNVLLPSGILVAERTLFLASVGLLVAVAGMARWLASGRWWADARQPLLVACGFLVLLGVIRSGRRETVWRNDGVLSVYTVRDAPRSYKAQRIYGNTLFWMGHVEDGRAAYDRAIALAPRSEIWHIRDELARHYRDDGRSDLEVEQLRASLRLMPFQQEARGWLVAAELRLGKYHDAERDAYAAIAYRAPQQVFRSLLQLADSAIRVKAPAGSVKVEIATDEFH